MMIKPGGSASLTIDNGNPSITLSLLWIPPGQFNMGSPEDEPNRHAYDDEKPFNVIFTSGFWISQFHITNQQWTRVVECEDYESGSFPKTNITWLEAIEYCSILGNKFQRLIPDGYHFSLPTEAQWEYTCRAGNLDTYPYQYSRELFMGISWCKENSIGKINPVGKKQPNDWGIYDMPGNVREWCYGIPLVYPTESHVDWIAEPRLIENGGLKKTNELRIVFLEISKLVHDKT
ncbi:MAG: formylglycine-generating enzyme family protein [Bacteroidota bacterium]